MGQRLTGVLCICGLMLISPLMVGAQQSGAGDSPARIGVLAYRGPGGNDQLWAPLAAYLEQAVPGVGFEIVPMTLTSAATLIEGGALDFVVTNPGHFVALEQDYAMSVVASRVQRKSDGTASGQFGSAIFTRVGSGIDLLQDVVGKRVLAVDAEAFGGFQIAWQAFDAVGVDLFRDTRLRFAGYPMDAIVSDVIAGKADVGIVRSGLIESLAQEQGLDIGALAVLNSNASPLHPDLVSTQVYPEWPFAALATTSQALSDQVALALLRTSQPGVAQSAGLVDHWTAPVSYRSVRALTARYAARGAYGGFWDWWVMVLAGAVGFGGLVFVVSLARLRFRRMAARSQSAQAEPKASVTPREGEILRLVAAGQSTKEIAQTLGISPKTVEFHRSNLLRKFGARSSSQLVAMATQGIP